MTELQERLSRPMPTTIPGPGVPRRAHGGSGEALLVGFAIIAGTVVGLWCGFLLWGLQ